MTKSKKCYFLTIPREIRNMIYINITSTCDLTEDIEEDEFDEISPPILIALENFIEFSMLYLNRQIHNEYLETIIPHSTLFIEHCGGSRIPSDLGLKGPLPSHIFKQIRKCHIYLSWDRAKYVSGNGKMDEWLDDYVASGFPNDSSWTPSKALYDDIKKSLAVLERILSPKTTVRVEISLDKMPDPNDLLQIGLLRDYVPSAGTASLISAVFDPKTITRLESASTVPWPEPGSLSVEYSIKTAESCTHEDHDAVKSEWETWQTSIGDRPVTGILQVGFELGGSMLKWRLTFKGTDSGFRGFEPVDVCATSYQDE